jgi:aminopeptidase N
MLAHEVAHQWFPARAYPASLADVWLSESVAEYLAGLAMGAADPDPRQAQGFREMVENWRHVAASCARDASLESAGQTRPESAAFDWYCVLYNRGPLVLHMLRTMVGHERFLQTLRAFLENAKGGAVTTQDLCAASESVVQQEMSWFFDQWHREPGIPEVHVEWGLEPAAGGGTALTGTVVQTAGPAFKKLLVPLVLEFGGGRREVRLVFQDRPHTEFRFELEARPAAVLVDPARNNLAVYR